MGDIAIPLNKKYWKENDIGIPIMDIQYPDKNIGNLIHVEPFSLEASEVMNGIPEIFHTNIINIHRIQNTYLMKKFIDMRQNDIENNKLNYDELFHFSKSPEIIISDGLDQRNSVGGNFGKGIYLSSSPFKCIQYNLNKDKLTSKLFRVSVLLGNNKKYIDGHNDPTLYKEPIGFDSCSGIITDYPETIIYNNNRVIITHVIEYNSNFLSYMMTYFHGKKETFTLNNLNPHGIINYPHELQCFKKFMLLQYYFKNNEFIKYIYNIYASTKYINFPSLHLYESIFHICKNVDKINISKKKYNLYKCEYIWDKYYNNILPYSYLKNIPYLIKSNEFIGINYYDKNISSQFCKIIKLLYVLFEIIKTKKLYTNIESDIKISIQEIELCYAEYYPLCKIMNLTYKYQNIDFIKLLIEMAHDYHLLNYIIFNDENKNINVLNYYNYYNIIAKYIAKVRNDNITTGTPESFEIWKKIAILPNNYIIPMPEFTAEILDNIKKITDITIPDNKIKEFIKELIINNIKLDSDSALEMWEKQYNVINYPCIQSKFIKYYDKLNKHKDEEHKAKKVCIDGYTDKNENSDELHDTLLNTDIDIDFEIAPAINIFDCNITNYKKYLKIHKNTYHKFFRYLSDMNIEPDTEHACQLWTLFTLNNKIYNGQPMPIFSILFDSEVLYNYNSNSIISRHLCWTNIIKIKFPNIKLEQPNIPYFPLE